MGETGKYFCVPSISLQSREPMDYQPTSGHGPCNRKGQAKKCHCINNMDRGGSLGLHFVDVSVLAREMDGQNLQKYFLKIYLVSNTVLNSRGYNGCLQPGPVPNPMGLAWHTMQLHHHSECVCFQWSFLAEGFTSRRSEEHARIGRKICGNNVSEKRAGERREKARCICVEKIQCG